MSDTKRAEQARDAIATEVIKTHKVTPTRDPNVSCDVDSFLDLRDALIESKCETAALQEENARLRRESSVEPDKNCPKCNGTGEADSGGFTPWDTPISVRCECTYSEYWRRWAESAERQLAEANRRMSMFAPFRDEAIQYASQHWDFLNTKGEFAGMLDDFAGHMLKEALSTAPKEKL